MTALTATPTTLFAAPGIRSAPEPPELRGLRRDGVRLLVGTPYAITHTRFAQIGRHLHSGDVLAVNTSATVPGLLDGTREGHPIVVHIANRLADASRVVELRTAPNAALPILDARAGEVIELSSGGQVELLTPYPRAGSSPGGAGDRLWRGCVRVPGRVGGTTWLRTPVRSATATSGTATRSSATRRSSPSAPAAPRCPAPAVRSAPNWSPA